ncbi:UDP-N-acetyl-D-mannosaminuronic acid transferase (WecB/TagA/CpsF family) [Paenibacillus sp. V4I9]|nr:UDP-N-acetyl-D-mannosaminuronic acid transferase (WecB/TagA/CpsF family) [Paenibacillus sp. V4I9]
MENCSQIMGIPVPKITMEDTVHIIDQIITKKKAELFHVVTLNPEIAMSCQHDLLLRTIMMRRVTLPRTVQALSWSLV